jgi:hypothetical protein
MAAFSTIALGALAIGGLALSGYSAYAGYQAQKKSANAQAEQQRVATRRSRRSAIRERAIRSSELVARANAFGSADSTGAIGGVGSLGSQLGSGLGYSTQMSGLSGIISNQATRASMFNSLGNFGSTVFGTALNFGAFQGSPAGTGSTSIVRQSSTQSSPQGVGSYYNFRPMG